MKKMSILLVGVLLMFSLSACGGTQGNGNSTSTQPPAAASPADDPQEAENPAATDGQGKTLVVYYSATGNTEEVANYIAEETGADVFELEPAEPYTDDDLNWTDDNSRVVYEHDNPDARDVALVSTTVPDWESYDTVFIGYPKMEQGYICV